MGRKRYSTTKGKANRKGYQTDFAIAMENTGIVGDGILVRSLLSTITINCGCTNKRVMLYYLWNTHIQALDMSMY